MDGAVVVADRPGVRPFTTADAMILMVAVALGLAMNRGHFAVLQDRPRIDRPDLPPLSIGAVQLGRIGNAILLWSLEPLSAALLILGLRRPRPVWESLLRRPGFVACFAIVAYLWLMLSSAALLPPQLLPRPGAMGEDLLRAGVVPLAWAGLILTRRWAPAPGWLDRTGRVLGLLYAACASAEMLLFRLCP